MAKKGKTTRKLVATRKREGGHSHANDPEPSQRATPKVTPPTTVGGVGGGIPFFGLFEAPNLSRGSILLIV